MKGPVPHLFVVLAAAAMLAGCVGTTSTNSLVGTYSIADNGTLNEFIRIEQRGNDYFMFEKQNGRWLDPVKVTPVDKVTLEALLKEPVTTSFVGLGNDMVAILKMPPLWRGGGFETKTGYWLMSILGPIDLHKQ